MALWLQFSQVSHQAMHAACAKGSARGAKEGRGDEQPRATPEKPIQPSVWATSSGEECNSVGECLSGLGEALGSNRSSTKINTKIKTRPVTTGDILRCKWMTWITRPLVSAFGTLLPSPLWLRLAHSTGAFWEFSPKLVGFPNVQTGPKVKFQIVSPGTNISIFFIFDILPTAQALRSWKGRQRAVEANTGSSLNDLKKKNSWKELKKIQNDQKLVEMSLSQLKCYCKLWCFFFKCGHCFAFFLTPFLKDFIPSGATRPSWTGRSRRETRSRTMSMGLRVLRLKLTAWQALTRYAELTLPGQLGQQQN